jgi:glycosyltransferase involved in cell wall biosynthesis
MRRRAELYHSSLNPYITIILPVYNSEKTISNSVKSILDQSYPYFELIIIDDGSTDNTATIVKRIEDPRIRFYLKDHMGPGPQRNYGLKKAKYDFIAFMDADDYSYQDRLSVQISYLLKNREVKILGSRGYFINSRSLKLSHFDVPLTFDKIKYFLPVFCPIITPSILLQKDVFEVVGEFSNTLKPGTDHEWLLRAATKNIHIENLDSRLIGIRLSDRSYTMENKGLVDSIMLSRGKKFLISEFREPSIKNYHYYFRMGLINYYYGPFIKAKKYFLKCCELEPSKIHILLRYLIPIVFLGENTIKKLRKKNISNYINYFLNKFGFQTSFSS